MPNGEHPNRPTTPNKHNPQRRAGSRRKNGKPKRGFWHTFGLAATILILVIAAVTLAYTAVVLKDLPDWDSTHMLSAETSFLYDTNGELFMELHAKENRTNVSLDEMPDYLLDCFITSEDTRFYNHFGIDIKRIFGSFVADVKAGSFAQGASTITMQLARNAILENQDKKLARKIKEAALALQIENRYSKDEILTMYLNEIYFGHGAYGVQAASQRYFAKDVSELTLSECAILTGVIKNPKYYSPILNIENCYKKRDVVLNNLANLKPEYKTQVAEAKTEEITLKEGVEESSYKYPWFTDYVIDEAEDIFTDLGIDNINIYTGGFRIYTTLDPTVQGLMEEAYANNNNFPSSNTDNPVQSSMAVMDVNNGNVLGLIGGREHTTMRGLNRAADITRQPGSAFKPIGVFSAAIEKGYSPATVANDVPTTFGSNYSPDNYDGRYRGVISMRAAAKDSVNIPAVKFLQMIGPKAGISMSKKLGIKVDESSDNNLALALGGLTYGTCPLDMAAAYAAFANAGVYSPPKSILKIVDSGDNIVYEATPNQTIAMKDTTAYMVTSMLQTVTNEGTGRRARLSRPVASKTGTTQLPDKSIFKGIKGNKDAWFAAYTPEMVGVVWMGYDEDQSSNGTPQYLRQIYGGKYPAQIWKYVIGGATKNLPAKSFTKPSGIVSATIDTKSGLLVSKLTPNSYTKTEIFDKNNLPKEISSIWQVVKICPETGGKATEYCPNPVEKILFTAPKESNKITGRGADSSLQVPTKTCTVHTTPQANVDNNDNKGKGNGNNNDGSADTTMNTPTDFTVSLNGTTAFLEWTDNISGPSVMYEIERWEETSNETKTITTYFNDVSDKNLSSGKTYYYRIRAVYEDKSQYSSWSSPVSVSVPAE
ncbi:MAG: PBP1A family penicillin-binding protein [Clostridia bacterium]|nr:PBP1A family penicillin-binding protein [Clostridia bacterium]